MNISLNVIDAHNLRQLDLINFSKSVKKTGRLLTVDFSHEFCSVGTEIIARLINKNFSNFKEASPKISAPKHFMGTAHSVRKTFILLPLISVKVLGGTDNVTMENMIL